ncbi:NADH-quinone oxidoreductase subunit NuoG [Chitinophaga nivalis]|uniref:NADH-quinone oxidoreductase subunit NuoG n=1 Tax=Chitinophaga nivalis TaxID=2991709 RepID=A0ABT3IHM4_9BACT|nr:NADH-quinone oxidoreductase subunit NuoG [Chitinophaga nivalis]MCW3466858.1 NADH-quinone oxidoreductase subunit NuoG [Chitinophaga nivalis]MCW3483451.1 NADH-quinone oxidoreductase subunit NuoG [Chitinophaga nivalis]
MPIIHIDNKPYEIKAGKNLLEACLSLGLNLPYFCWHPALGSVGACRQCAVKVFKDEADTKGRIVMSCMEPVKDQLRLSVDDKEAADFRKHIIGWLMTNHPHDCAVCDEGGACHLQDMTVMTGHSYRDYHFTKRTHRNQYLGPFLNHEMNRCIQCYRCVRFYKDFAGGKDLDVFAAHNHVYFGRQEEGTLESEFSGNLAEICPTGVFTDKTLKEHYTRKWDMTYAPSVCQGCGLGCNITAGERYGSLRQISNRFNSAVNGYFLCDRGRYGYEFVNSDQRIKEPIVRHFPGEGANGLPVMQHIRNKVKAGKVIGIGSPRASLESNYILKQLVGAQQFYLGVSAADHELVSLGMKILQQGPVRAASLQEAAAADVVLILGEDITNTAPMLALSVRQAVRQVPVGAAVSQIQVPTWQDAAVREAVQDDKGPLFILNVQETKLDELARGAYHTAPDNIARIGFGVSHLLSSKMPEVTGMSEQGKAAAEQIAVALKNAKNPLIIAGYGSGSEAVLKSAANVAWALYDLGIDAMLTFTVPECNSIGLEMLGGARLESAVDQVLNGSADTVIILENDLYRRMDQHSAELFFKHTKEVILLDHLYNATAEKATAILPAGTFAESDGSLVNNEGRAQRFFQVFTPASAAKESWRWLLELAAVLGHPTLSSLAHLDDVVKAIVQDYKIFEGLESIAPSADFRIAGQKIPREPHRYSGRTAMLANINVSEPKPPEDPDTAMSFTMEGYRGEPPAAMIPFFWSPGWNSIQSVNKFQEETGGPLHGGESGKRLINPARNKQAPFFTDVPEPFLPLGGHLLLVPLFHIFGSEELSVHTPGIAARMPAPYIMLHSADAERLQITAGHLLHFTDNGHHYTLPVIINDTLQQGAAGIPVGLPDMQIAEAPQLIKI